MCLAQPKARKPRTISIFFCFHRRRRPVTMAVADSTDTKPIPAPPGWPLVGNAFDFDTELPLRTFQNFAEQYGEIYRMHLPSGSPMVVSSHALVHELCDEKRFRKPVAGALAEIRNGVHDGLFTAREEEANWGIAHRILMPAFGPASIQGMFTEMHEIASQLALKWARHGEDTPIMVTDDFTRLTLDTLALCTMNFRFNSYYHDELHPFIAAMGDFLTESGARATRPSVMSVLYQQANRKYWEDIEVLRRTAQSVLDTRRKHPTGRKDLVSAMLEGVDPKTGQKLSDSSIIDNLITFLIAGHETTSGLLSFAFYLLIKHPEAYRKAQDEVDSVIGKGPIKVEHMNKLPYIAAVLRETLRLCPTIPVIARQAREDTVIGDGKYLIKKDERLVLLLAQSHLDPKVYGETAKDFVPERMLDDSFERLTKEFPDCWKPFGTGMRACIGRPFAWQEAVLVMAMLLQNFDFSLDDPTYELQYKQTLTTKPKNFHMRASLRDGLTATELEHRLAGGGLQSTGNNNSSKAKANGITSSSAEARPMSIFYGSNTGTCESLAQRLATNAASHGFKATVVEPMDAATGNLPTDRPVVIITASFEGQPPDNAARFCSWLLEQQRLSAHINELSGVAYAVFGCGHHDWSQTLHRVPRRVDGAMSERGATRLCDMGLTDVADGDMFTDFEQWEDDVFWPAVEARYGTQKTTAASGGRNDDLAPSSDNSLDVQFSSPRSSTLRQDVKEATVVDERVLTAAGAPPKKHMEIQLPDGMVYKVGDYLAVLPVNSKASITRVMRQFRLSWDAHIAIASDRWTALPTGTPVPVWDVLGSYVELSQPATKRGILRLADAAEDEPTKQHLRKLAGNSYSTEISLKRTSILDLLEQFPSVSLPFGAFLSLLPPLRPRQYSISSSPLTTPTRATLTYSLVSAPSLSNPAKHTHEGVATSYLASLSAGDKLLVSVRPTHTAFRLPDDSETTPLVCIAAGSGLAPFRGFVQERAALISQSQGQSQGQDQNKNRKLAPALLFFGCRGPQVDDLYREEFDEWQNIGAVDVRRAFSRQTDDNDEAQGCRHAQDRVWRDREEVKALWERGARVYVCGSRAFGDDVKRVVGKVVLGEGANEEEIAEWYEGVRNERYATDVFD
ncbi:putative bifunctional P-450:NADPH-P450 reductase [Parathielavia appendiculata]|uniref:Bifunctional cytochrome P450/NADPH--P450 reductase n=1 Tax=Parathielavia appendiculata TaxID=2587402 RepID=A0AAN6TQ93_9PEZI|nr:putative bifunctional P-450:NADPH-P450 reductase [Parathielavia appendiculata]